MISNIIELEKKVRDICDKLSSTVDPPVYDREAAAKWGNFKPEHKGNPNYHFMLNLCYGPWRDGRQKDVWNKVYRKFEELGGDITKIDETLSKGDLDFPLTWQFDHVLKLSKHLNDNGMTFAELLERWKALSGLEIRNEMQRITNANTTKTFSTFIRDYLGKEDIFPIDTRVKSMLNKLGLPNNEDLMVLLCQQAEIMPSKLERLFYEFPENHCEKGRYNECPIRDDCYCFILRGECCKI